MNHNIYYRPLTATPFEKNISYTELKPCENLHSYVRCFWGTGHLLIQAEKIQDI